MDTAKTVGMDAAKTASKRVVQKTAEAIGDLIGNKIADKITSAGKPKNKGKKEDNETNKRQEICIPPGKRQQIIDSSKLVSAIFIKFLFFHQMIALQKLRKMLFISSKKLFSLLRYSIFCISVLPSLSTCQPLL